MPDDHSEVVPLLPIPNRTVKRFSADDSAGSRVKVGHRQAITAKTPSHVTGRFLQCSRLTPLALHPAALKKTQKAFAAWLKTVLYCKASLITAKQVKE